MAQVKGDLGPEAIILHTQATKVGGLFGLFGTRMIEVVAAAEQATPRSLAAAMGAITATPPQPAPSVPAAVMAPVIPPPQPPFDTARQARLPLVEEMAVQRPAARAPAPDQAPQTLDAVVQDLGAVRSMLGRMMNRLDAPTQVTRMNPELQEIYSQLIASGVHTDLALDLLKRIRVRVGRAGRTEVSPRSIARRLIERDLEAVETIGAERGARRVVALVGPTGVGKTTTLAKLAALHALGKKMTVSMITADTYRIAAAEQLRTYCDILQVPLEVVYDPEEIGAALARQHNSDLVLVDTAGRSPRNAEHMAELRRYLEELRPDETYLALSLTSNDQDAALVAEAYQTIHYDRLLFTKMDESTKVGLVYNLAVQYRRPLSYITTGQSVPDDIEVVRPNKLTSAILGE